MRNDEIQENRSMRSTERHTRTSGTYFSLIVTLRLLIRRNSKFERLKTSVAGSETFSDVPSCNCEKRQGYEMQSKTKNDSQIKLVLYQLDYNKCEQLPNRIRTGLLYSPIRCRRNART